MNKKRKSIRRILLHRAIMAFDLRPKDACDTYPRNSLVVPRVDNKLIRLTDNE